MFKSIILALSLASNLFSIAMPQQQTNDSIADQLRKIKLDALQSPEGGICNRSGYTHQIFVENHKVVCLHAENTADGDSAMGYVDGTDVYCAFLADFQYATKTYSDTIFYKKCQDIGKTETKSFRVVGDRICAHYPSHFPGKPDNNCLAYKGVDPFRFTNENGWTQLSFANTSSLGYYFCKGSDDTMRGGECGKKFSLQLWRIEPAK